MTFPDEKLRRKPGSFGSPVRLADGHYWMLPALSFRASGRSLTRPDADGAVDRLFDSTILDEALQWQDLWSVARGLLLANYDLSDEEISLLLSTSPGEEGNTLAADILEALFCRDGDGRTFTRWARASLLANGIADVEIGAPHLLDALSILVMTNRTVPFARFSDACRVREERNRLESLV